MNCKDEELKAKLYSNRAAANFNLGEDFKVFDSFVKLTVFQEKIGRCVSSCVHQQRIFHFINFGAGNFHGSLSDAKTAADLQPSYVKAIVTGKGLKRKW